MEICSCGYNKNYHNNSRTCFKFRKNGSYSLDKKDGNNIVRVNADDFVTKKVQEVCTKYQCGKGKPLHDMGMFDHKYEPCRVYNYHEVNLTITSNFPCYYSRCGKNIEDHRQMDHSPVVFVIVENLKEDDIQSLRSDYRINIVTDVSKIPPEPDFEDEREKREIEQSRLFDSEIYFTGQEEKENKEETSLQKKIRENIKNTKEKYSRVQKFVSEKIIGQPYEEAKKRFAEIGMELWHVACCYSSIFSYTAVIPDVDSNNCMTAVTFHSIKTCDDKLREKEERNE